MEIPAFVLIGFGCNFLAFLFSDDHGSFGALTSLFLSGICFGVAFVKLATGMR